MAGFPVASIELQEGSQTRLTLTLSIAVDNPINVIVELNPATVPGVDVMNTELMIAAGATSTEVHGFVVCIALNQHSLSLALSLSLYVCHLKLGLN